MAKDIARFVILLLVSICLAQEASDLPAGVSPAVITGESSGVCPSRNTQLQKTRDEIGDILYTFMTRINCACGGAGQWTRIAHLNMSDPSQQCPSSWNLITTPVRGCASSITSRASCDSAIFPSNGQTYSHVCGRVNAYQQGTPDAFQGQNLDGNYVDGVSLTHGAAGSRQHIWTFVASNYETRNIYYSSPNCACTNINKNWPHQVPSFVGNNYFCDTGNRGPESSFTKVYSEDPLWDGEGCGPTSTCCEFNNPPWFCTTLQEPTTDDIELRICRSEPISNEDVIVSFVDISVM